MRKRVEKSSAILAFLDDYQAFLISSAGSLLASKKSKNIHCGKNAAIIRWPSLFLKSSIVYAVTLRTLGL